MAKFFKENAVITANDGTGSISIELPVNTAPSEYTIQVLSKDATNGGYSQYADSKDNTDSCGVVTKIYDNMPTNLVGVQAFFTVFSIVVLIVSYTYDRAKQA